MRKIKLLLFIGILFFVSANNAFAQQGSSFELLSGSEIIQSIQAGSLSQIQAAEALAAQTNSTISEAQTILGGLTQPTNNSITSGQFLDEFRQGNISANLTEAVAEVRGLGTIVDVSSLEAALTSPPVLQELQTVLNGSGATAMNQLVSSVANVLGGEVAMQQLLAPTLNQALQTSFQSLSTGVSQAFTDIGTVLGAPIAVLNDLPAISMDQLLEGALNNAIPVDQINQALTELGQIPATMAENITNNLLSNAGINLSQAGQLLNFVQTGQLPGSVVETLSALPSLGDITGLASLTNVLTSPDITDALQQAMLSGGVQGFNQALSSITSVLGGTEALQLLESQAGAITGALNAANSAIAGALGGLTNLEGLVSGIGENFLEQLSGSQMIDAIQSGLVSITDAAQGIANLVTAPLAQIEQTLQNLSIGGVNIAQAGQIISQITSGQITAAVGEIVSAIPSLGDISAITDIADVLSNVNIVGELGNILASGGAEAVQQAIAGITNIVGGVEGIVNSATQAGAAAIANAINAIDPALVTSLGGLTALTGSIFSGMTSVLSLGIGLGGGCTSQCDKGGNVEPPPPGGSCSSRCLSCAMCRPRIQNNHDSIREHVTDQFEIHQQWFINTFINDNVLPALARMTTQLSATAMHQIGIIGRFFDAKHQLETQRLFQQLAARAHKDFTPSAGLCEFGSMMGSIASSSRKSDLTKVTIANRSMARLMGSRASSSSAGTDSDKISRRAKFINTYCNPQDNSNGLTYLCSDNPVSRLQTQIDNTQTALDAETNPIIRTAIQSSLDDLNNNQMPAAQAAQKERMNKDVNYVRYFDSPLTLEIDFTDTTGTDVTPDEEDVFALSANLYAHNVLPIIGARILADGNGNPKTGAYKYMNYRSLAAKKSVAHNSFATIAGYKAEGYKTAGGGDEGSAPFLRRIVQDLGVPPAEIESIIGANPSYHAQMEVLTSSLYKRNSFYTALVDKPANVRRKSTALRTINLMQERDIYNSLLRSEAILAVTLETMLQNEDERTKRQLNSLEGQRDKVAR